MEEEDKKGKRKTSILTKGAWRYIKEKLNGIYGKEHTPDSFKTESNQLRGKWEEFTSLVKKETLPGYNSSIIRIVARRDQWEKLCEEYRFASQFKTEGCSHYDKLCVILWDTSVSGANQHPSIKRPSISDDNGREGNIKFDQEEDDYQSDRKPNVCKYERKRKIRESAEMEFVNPLTNSGENMKIEPENLEMSANHGITISASNAIGEVDEQNNMQDDESLFACLGFLQGLQGIDGTTFSKALNLLKEDATWRGVFLRLSRKRRKDWVRSLA